MCKTNEWDFCSRSKLLKYLLFSNISVTIIRTILPNLLQVNINLQKIKNLKQAS